MAGDTDGNNNKKEQAALATVAAVAAVADGVGEHHSATAATPSENHQNHATTTTTTTTTKAAATTTTEFDKCGPTLFPRIQRGTKAFVEKTKEGTHKMVEKTKEGTHKMVEKTKEVFARPHQHQHHHHHHNNNHNHRGVPDKKYTKKEDGGGGGNSPPSSSSPTQQQRQRKNLADGKDDDDQCRKRPSGTDVSSLSKDEDFSYSTSFGTKSRRVMLPKEESSPRPSITGNTLVLGPRMELLTEDSTIMMVVSLSIAVYPTYGNWNTIIQNHQIPLSVAATWCFVAYCLGGVVSIARSVQMISSAASQYSKRPIISEVSFVDRRKMEKELTLRMEQAEKRRRHSILINAVETIGPKSHGAVRFEDVRKKAEEYTKKVWTNLKVRVDAREWEKTYDATKVHSGKNYLMERLLKTTKFHRTTRREHLKSLAATQQRKIHSTTKLRLEEEEREEKHGDDTAASSAMTPLGHLDSSVLPETLDDLVICPSLMLRGLDVFLTEDAETEVATHPWLIRQGLRDVPTILFNVVTQWGNMLIYMQLPDFVGTKFSEIQISDDDPEDVRAIKHFLKGDDDYCNPRLKIIPSVAEGPLAVRLLAPPKKEIVVNGETIPCTWRRHDEQITSSGRKLRAALEVELDCLTGRAIRSMAGILKRNLETLAIDIAVCISKPEGQKEDEPAACLGLFRFNHIEIEACPPFPDRFADEAESTGQTLDVCRASKMLKLSAADIDSIAKAVVGDIDDDDE